MRHERQAFHTGPGNGDRIDRASARARGTSSATVAVTLPRNSVGTAQLKANAVTAAKVKNGSLRLTDFAAGQIPAGPAGPQGAKGDKGDKGDPGRIGPIVVRSASVSVPGGGVAENGNYDSAHVQKNCDPDEKAISGGTGWSTDADTRSSGPATCCRCPTAPGPSSAPWRRAGTTAAPLQHSLSTCSATRADRR